MLTPEGKPMPKDPPPHAAGKRVALTMMWTFVIGIVFCLVLRLFM